MTLQYNHLVTCKNNICILSIYNNIEEKIYAGKKCSRVIAQYMNSLLCLMERGTFPIVS